MFEHQTFTLDALRAAKRCVACGRKSADRVRPPCASGVKLDPEVVVAVCSTCLTRLRVAASVPFYLRRRSALLLPVVVPLVASFLLPTQGVLAVRGPLVITCVFAATWIALLVAIARFRRHAAGCPFVVVAARGDVVDVQLPSRRAPSVAVAPEGGGPYRSPSEKPQPARVRPMPPVDRMAGKVPLVALVITAIVTGVCWNELYARLVVSNPDGTDCDLSVDGSHIQVATGVTTLHVRDGRRRIVVTCARERNYPDKLYEPRFTSADTVYLDVNKLDGDNGLEVSRDSARPSGRVRVVNPPVQRPF